MGFALWMDADGGVAWAQGTHEYQPLGSAVISLSGQFRERDFGRGRRSPSRMDQNYVGLFGSLVDVNEFLRAQGLPGARRRRPDRLTRYL